MIILIQKYIHTEQLLVVSVLPNNQLSDGILFFFSHIFFKFISNLVVDQDFWVPDKRRISSTRLVSPRPAGVLRSLLNS